MVYIECNISCWCVACDRVSAVGRFKDILIYSQKCFSITNKNICIIFPSSSVLRYGSSVLLFRFDF